MAFQKGDERVCEEIRVATLLKTISDELIIKYTAIASGKFYWTNTIVERGRVIQDSYLELGYSVRKDLREEINTRIRLVGLTIGGTQYEQGTKLIHYSAIVMKAVVKGIYKSLRPEIELIKQEKAKKEIEDEARRRLKRQQYDMAVFRKMMEFQKK